MALINLFRRWVPALIYDQFIRTFRFFFFKLNVVSWLLFLQALLCVIFVTFLGLFSRSIKSIQFSEALVGIFTAMK